MPIGPVTPGNYTVVTPDVLPAEVVSIQTPSPTMPVVAADLAALTLKTLNIKQWIKEILNGARVFNVVLAGTLTPNGGVDIQPGVVVRVRNTGTLQMDAGSIFYHHGTGLFRLAATTNIQIDGDFPVTGNVSCTDLDASGDVTCGGDLATSGHTSCLGGATLYGTSTNTGILSDSGVGRYRKQITVGPATSTNFNFGATGGATQLTSLIHFTGTLSGDIHYLLQNVGAGEPDMVDVSVVDANMGGHSLIIQRNDGTPIATLTGAAGAEAVRVYFHAGSTNWRRFCYLG